MSSFESRVNQNGNKMEEDRLSIPLLKYFWLSSPLAGVTKENVPKFLRSIDVLKNFTENDLRLFSKFIHLRSFEDGEVIFEQDQVGIGFYFIFNGNVELWVKNPDDLNTTSLLLTLERGSYFGELALLQDTSYRNATAKSQGPSQLLGFYRPDLEEIIDTYPVVGAKLLQSVANILANRLHNVTSDYKSLKAKHQILLTQNSQTISDKESFV